MLCLLTLVELCKETCLLILACHCPVLQLRRSTHQLAAKYAAMLPLAAVDPELSNKEAAARMLREWVHSRRAAVQQSIMCAAAAEGGAAGVRGGGSTLQDQPEMLLPYGLYILAHHPDFPQVSVCVVPVCDGAYSSPLALHAHDSVLPFVCSC
jgi:hypothetical protein